MNPPTNTAPGPVDLLLLAAIAAAHAAGVLVAAALALLLTVAGWRPAAQPRIPHSVDLHPPAEGIPSLAELRVIELRALARAAGLRQLARSGRRADLLRALAP